MLINQNFYLINPMFNCFYYFIYTTNKGRVDYVFLSPWYVKICEFHSCGFEVSVFVLIVCNLFIV